ncbi:MAG: M14 family metallopeptidase [Thermoplasmatota archaeon]
MQRLALLALLLILAPVAEAQIDRNLVHNVFSVDDQFADWDAAYPEFVERITIGESEGGFPLHGIVVTDESVPFNEPPHSADTKWRVYLDGGHHGNEFLGVEITLYYMERLLDLASQGDPATLDLLARTEIQMVPILNVEGNLRDTRVNLNGVDPNRNYDFGHTACAIPIGLTCGGPEPFSESEVRANAEHVAAISPDLWLSMHTGIEVLYYPAGDPFPEGQAIDQPLFTAMEVPFEQVVGGRIDMAGGPAPAVGSAEDWGYAVHGITAFVYEVHNDQNLPVYGEPISDLLQQQIDGLAWLIEGTPKWGAWLTLDGRQLVNKGLGVATEITFDGMQVPDLAPGGAWALPTTIDGEVTWSYDVLQVETSRVRSHTAVVANVADAPGESSPGLAIPVLLVALIALARR